MSLRPKSMWLKWIGFIVTALAFPTVALAQETQPLGGDTWTEIGGYGLMSAISGDTKIKNVTSDVDVSFKDILENLDFGFMGFAEHRRGKWSFIGDVFYSAIGDKTVAANATTSVSVDVEVKQFLYEGFVGYRAFEQARGDAQLGIDLLGGFRYNQIEVDLGVEVQTIGLSAAASRNRKEDWADGVIGVRAEYGGSHGWGVYGWADIGKGQDSSSYQLAGFVSYRFENNVRVFGGYRHLHFDYEDTNGANPIELDLDISGPMFGLSYRF